MRSTATAIFLILISSTMSALASTPPKLVRLELSTSNAVVTCTINDRIVTPDELDRLLTKLATIDRDQTLMIQVDADTTTKELMELVANCRGKGFVSFRIFLLSKGNTMEITAEPDTTLSPIEIIESESEGKL
jgi:biopolymer transport protein ExbD